MENVAKKAFFRDTSKNGKTPAGKLVGYEGIKFLSSTNGLPPKAMRIFAD